MVDLSGKVAEPELLPAFRFQFVEGEEVLGETGVREFLPSLAEPSEDGLPLLVGQGREIGFEMDSLHSVRPFACREYLVTSPAKNCSNPTAASVRQLPMPVKPPKAGIELTKRFLPSERAWLPLIDTTDPDRPPSPRPIFVGLKEFVHQFLLSLGK